MIQWHLTQNCPQLVRPINLRTSRFNQHFTKGSLIIEVGTNGNTLDEALVSTKYLATAIHQTLDELRS
jgi:stage II sporulation protein P